MLFRAKELKSTCVVNLEGRKTNLASVRARGLPVCKQSPERSGSLAIVASGPSVRDHLDELRNWPDDVWAINGAYDYLLGNGIVPAGFFALDPLPGLAEYLQHPNPATTFYLASTCAVEAFDALAGHKVEVFHPADDGMEFPGEWIIGGGTTALTRVPYLALLHGWRDITVFGADSSYDGREYCYEWGTYALDIAQPKMNISINGEGPFETELGLMKQVSQLWVISNIINKKRPILKFKCRGLLAAFMRAPTLDDSVIERVEDDERTDAA